MFSVFVVPKISSTDFVVVEGDEAHHAINVLRLSVGEELLISDGRGAWARCAITATGKRTFTADLIERGHDETALPRLTVVQALTKSDRTKEMLELLVEAGVDRIIPWSASRSISKWQSGSRAKWQSAVFAAAKQSRRFTIPIVEESISTHDVAGERAIVLHESADSSFSPELGRQLAALPEIVLVIGPEGGITPEELAIFEAKGCKVIRMGRPVLRSAHAGIAALSAVQTLIGRW